MRDRIQSLDAIKAFAIFLVVLGHLVQKCVMNFDDNYLFKFIYSFHMPLFIFISGFVSYRPTGFKDKYLFNKITSLILPYFSWLLIGILISFFNNPIEVRLKIINFLLYPDNGLWFLWVLFWMHFIMYICFLISKKHYLLLLTIFYLVYFLVIFFSGIDNIFCCKTYAFLFPYFLLGYISNKNISVFKSIISKWWLLLPLLFIIPIFWHRTNKIMLPGISFNPVLITYAYKSFAGFVGVIVVFGLFSGIHDFKKIVLDIGRNTLSIYAMNLILINWIGFIFGYIENIILFCNWSHYITSYFLFFDC